MKRRTRTIMLFVQKMAGFAVAMAIASLVLTFIFTGIPSILGYRLFFVVSESMEPTIQTGQFVVAKSYGVNQPKVGEIAAYKKQGRLFGKTVIHRIISEDDGLYEFQGDNNPRLDAPVPLEWIWYQVILY